MATAATEHRAGAKGRVRQIGPIGTASRLALGLVAIALPIAVAGLTWWDGLAWAVLTLLATALSRPVLAAVERHSRNPSAGELGACSAAACVLGALLLGVSVGVGLATPARGDVAVWGFVGLSLLLAAARGDRGCELLAFPNALMRRRDRVGCIIFTPIDRAEARHRAPA